MASVIFKNTIINATKDDSANNLWFKIDAVMRSNIKEALLTMLGNENESQIRDASLCLAILARVEVPLG